jgi:hypothetical protein
LGEDRVLEYSSLLNGMIYPEKKNQINERKIKEYERREAKSC